MWVKLEHLEIGTQFEYFGGRYKKTGKGWSGGALLEAQKNWTEKPLAAGVISADCRLTACSRYLGGKFQESSRLEVWISTDAVVEVS